MVAPLDDQAGAAENGKLLREIAGLDLDGVEQLVDRVIPLAEQLQNPDAGGVAEGPEELRFGLVQGSRHGTLAQQQLIT